mmetsp:Transcript_60028/g.140422  ORF Transcript_60028/g.140422 Transcript_60028/m.140422 type:complete len:230 (-) Transcript_60028:37-726(-)
MLKAHIDAGITSSCGSLSRRDTLQSLPGSTTPLNGRLEMPMSDPCTACSTAEDQAVEPVLVIVAFKVRLELLDECLENVTLPKENTCSRAGCWSRKTCQSSDTSPLVLVSMLTEGPWDAMDASLTMPWKSMAVSSALPKSGSASSSSIPASGWSELRAESSPCSTPPGEAETVGPVSAKVSFSWGSRLRQPSCPFDAYGCRLLTSVRPNWPQINRKASKRMQPAKVAIL